jgi:hypothetical protein
LTHEQDRLLEVLDRDTAQQRWWDWLRRDNTVLDLRSLLDVLLAKRRTFYVIMAIRRYVA